MNLRRTAQAVVLASLLGSAVGCGGEAEKNLIPKEKYDQIWTELTDLMAKKKGKQSLKDQDAILSKHSVNRDQWKASIDVYGISDEVMKRQRASLDALITKKATPSASPPP